MRLYDVCLDVDLWIVPLNAVRVRPLSPAEEDRAARFRFPADAHRFRAAHSALHAVLGRHRRGSLEFRTGSHGKPYLESGPYFSLSHSGDLAAVAVCEGAEVGVDIERRREVPEAARIVRRFFRDEEFDGDFFRSWARKEAILKAAGVGLGGQAVGIYACEEFEPMPGYAGAVAVEAPAITVHRREYAMLPE